MSVNIWSHIYFKGAQNVGFVDHQADQYMCNGLEGPQRQSNGRIVHVRWRCEVSSHNPAWGGRERGQWATFHREADAAAARATRHLRLQLGTGGNRAKGLSLGQPKMHIHTNNTKGIQHTHFISVYVHNVYDTYMCNILCS